MSVTGSLPLIPLLTDPRHTINFLESRFQWLGWQCDCINPCKWIQPSLRHMLYIRYSFPTTFVRDIATNYVCCREMKCFETLKCFGFQIWSETDRIRIRHSVLFWILNVIMVATFWWGGFWVEIWALSPLISTLDGLNGLVRYVSVQHKTVRISRVFSQLSERPKENINDLTIFLHY